MICRYWADKVDSCSSSDVALGYCLSSLKDDGSRGRLDYRYRYFYPGMLFSSVLITSSSLSVCFPPSAANTRILSEMIPDSCSVQTLMNRLRSNYFRWDIQHISNNKEGMYDYVFEFFTDFIVWLEVMTPHRKSNLKWYIWSVFFFVLYDLFFLVFSFCNQKK